jgi:hypothetical protein
MENKHSENSQKSDTVIDKNYRITARICKRVLLVKINEHFK